MDVQLQIPDDVARVIQDQQPDLSRAALEALALNSPARGDRPVLPGFPQVAQS